MKLIATLIATSSIFISSPGICAENNPIALGQRLHNLPALSTIEGEIATGGYIPAFGHPTPILIKAALNARLPDGRIITSIDRNECALIAYAEGVINQDRAVLRINNLTCVSSEGRIFETSDIHGYVSGDDRLSGVGGKVMTSEGAVVAKAFLDGIAKEVSGNSDNNSPASLGLANVVRSYKNMAAPVVKVEPYTKVQIVLTKALDLSFGPPLIQSVSGTQKHTYLCDGDGNGTSCTQIK